MNKKPYRNNRNYRNIYSLLPFTILLLAILASGCNTTNSSVVSIETTETSSKENTPTALELPISCWRKEELNKEKDDLSGSILYYDSSVSYAKLLDLNNFEILPIENLTTTLVGISRDRNLISFITTSTAGDITNYIYSSPNSKSTHTAPKDSYLDIYNAFTEGDGVILRSRHDTQESKDFTENIFVLPPNEDVFATKEIQLPYFYENTTKYHTNSFFVRYSPNLRYVIYPAVYQNIKQFVLYDIYEQHIVWHGWANQEPTVTSVFPPPIWKPDSSAVTIVDLDGSQQVFYNISTSGKKEKIAEVNDVQGLKSSTVSFPTWSPDGRYLSFRVERHLGDMLVIYDSIERIFLVPCVTLGDWGYEPRWSSNSTQLAFAPINKIGDLSNIFLVDLKNELIIEIPGKLVYGPIQILGWTSWNSH